jgi:hypothetical protein
MHNTHSDKGGQSAPFVVYTTQQLRDIVAHVQDVGEFCFDVETRGFIDHHSDISDAFERMVFEKRLVQGGDGIRN